MRVIKISSLGCPSCIIMNNIINKLTDEMLKHASNMEFEKAAELRDKIKELEKIKII